MAIRPNNHITGDKAVNAISYKLIPAEWTISKPESDYGLDMLIEVVNKNETTGKFFFIQSKGTNASYKNGQISYLMDVARLKDYSQIEIPVLFVYYSTTEDKFWGRWMNSLYKTLTDIQKNQKTISLKFSPDNEIDSEYLKSLASSITLSITRQTSVTANSIPDEFKLLHSNIVNFANKFIGNSISLDNHLSCSSINISYNGTLQNGSAIVEYNGKKTTLPIKVENFEFLYNPYVTAKDCPDYILHLIYTIAFFLSALSPQCADYVLSYPQRGIFNDILLENWTNFILQIPDEKIQNIFNLFNISILDNNEYIAQAIIFRTFLHSLHKDPNAQDIYNRILNHYLSTNNNSQTKATLLYNLANLTRDYDLHESLTLYIKAAKCYPSYKDRHYWWKELAGVLYLLKHYKFSELFYKKARSLDVENCNPETDILIADCLISQGKINEALSEELYHFKRKVKFPGITLLKTNVTRLMHKNRIDCFNPITLFNNGLKAAHAMQYEKAMQDFLYTWRLNDNDTEALVNAFICSLKIKNTKSMSPMIMVALRELNPQEGYKLLVSKILSNKSYNNNAEQIIENIRSILFDDIN